MPSLAPAMFGGGLFGDVTYAVTHYYLHHGQPSKGVTQKLKALSSTEVSLATSLQSSNEGIRHNLLILGSCIRDISAAKSCREK
ncbi:hypothetical protein Ancab_019771 [Ancistrocladus abbreviatus]